PKHSPVSFVNCFRQCACGVSPACYQRNCARTLAGPRFFGRGTRDRGASHGNAGDFQLGTTSRVAGEEPALRRPAPFGNRESTGDASTVVVAGRAGGGNEPERKG